MRVALVTSHLGAGGAERQVVLWAEACTALGHAPLIVALEPPGDSYAVGAGVEVVHIGKSRALDLPRVVARLHRIVRDCDVVFAFQAYPTLCCALAERRGRFCVVAGNDPRHWGDTSRYPAWLYRWAFRRAQLGCAPSQGIADCHEAMGIRPRGGWRRVPNIVDAAAFVESSSAKHGALFVGRLVALKDPWLAIDAARAAGTPLTLLGQGELGDELERQVAAGERPGVELRGFVEHPWREYARHRVTVVTSRYESFGNMIIESLAAGTPVVSVDCDFGPRELIGSAVYSRLTGREPEALADAIRTVTARPYTAEERAECLEIARRYTPDAVRPEIERALADAAQLT